MSGAKMTLATEDRIELQKGAAALQELIDVLGV
jgi:hypothetical protein